MSLIKCYVEQAIKELKEADAARVKAGKSAGSVEGYQLMRSLQSEIKAGAPGGKSFALLGNIAKKSSAARHPNKPLLGAASNAIRYAVTELGNGSTQVSIGAIEGKVSRSWINIMIRQQAGFKEPVTKETKTYFSLIGYVLKDRKSRRAQGLAKFFFLKKETTELKIPARDIIDSFWRAHEREAVQNIKSNFEAKLK